jgi:hypothetical protein
MHIIYSEYLHCAIKSMLWPDDDQNGHNVQLRKLNEREVEVPVLGCVAASLILQQHCCKNLKTHIK